MVSSVPQLQGDTELVAESAPMHELLKRVARFAKTDAPVVVLGETGTGKELIARVLHLNSPRAARPFVAINVAALPAELLESELFGHGKGAFTGASSMKQGLLESAHGGTLFLDEIGEMPLKLQSKLLRAVQDGEVRRVGENAAFAVDVRVVCATHRDLSRLVASGDFREDLYYRLKVLSLTVPPLRERRADILPLARHFLRLECAASRRRAGEPSGRCEAQPGEQRLERGGAEQRSTEPPGARGGKRAAAPGPRCACVGFTAEAEQRLIAYGWPGNVRELLSAVRHGAALKSGSQVGVEDLPDELSGAPGHAMGGAADRLSSIAAGALRSLAEVEREHIARVLQAVGGSQTQAAEVLGIGRNTLWRKLRAAQGTGPDSA